MINAESAAYRNDVNIAAIYTFRVTSQAQLFKFLHDIILITGFAICSDVIKTFFKTKTKTFLWCILEADRKAFFIFGRKRKFWRKWNSIYSLKRKRTFIFGQKRNESHLIILVFFFLFHTFIHYVSPTIPRQHLVQFRLFLQVVFVDGIPLSSCTVYRYLCGIFLDDFATHEQFAFLVYCYRVKAIFHNLCTVLHWRLWGP